MLLAGSSADRVAVGGRMSAWVVRC